MLLPVLHLAAACLSGPSPLQQAQAVALEVADEPVLRAVHQQRLELLRGLQPAELTGREPLALLQLPQVAREEHLGGAMTKRRSLRMYYL